MFNRNIKDIASAEGLRWLGFLIAFGHVMTFLYVMPDAVFHLANIANPQCWSYFPGCDVLHVPSKLFWLCYFLMYLALAVFSLYCFFKNKVRAAYFSLLALTVVKMLFLIVDRNFMGNYHFMHLLYSGVFLFLPQKQFSLKILVTWFYLAAGSLKLNIEWLSGAAVGGGPALLPPILQQWSYAYVVILELIMVWGLFAKDARIRWLAFAQFFIFHLVSSYWVGYFYPSIALSMLMIFPFSWISGHKEPAASKPIFILVSALSVFQAIAFASEKDPAIFTHQRLFSMNMYDARSVCAINFLLHKEEKVIAYNPDLKPFGVRVRCDTNLILNQAKNLCQMSHDQVSFKSLDVSMLSKRLTDSSFTEVFHIKDVCPRIEKATYLQWLRGDL